MDLWSVILQNPWRTPRKTRPEGPQEEYLRPDMVALMINKQRNIGGF